MGNILNGLRKQIPHILGKLVDDIYGLDMQADNSEWFATKIYQITELNLLTAEEINEYFGWYPYQTKQIREYHLGSRSSDGLLPKPYTRMPHLMFGLVSIMAMKHKVSFIMQFELIVEPEVVVPEKVVPEPVLPWHEKLEDLDWFRLEVPGTTRQKLKEAEILTLGQLLILSEEKVWKLRGITSGSGVRFLNILNRHQITLGSVTKEDYELYMAHQT